MLSFVTNITQQFIRYNHIQRLITSDHTPSFFLQLQNKMFRFHINSRIIKDNLIGTSYLKSCCLALYSLCQDPLFFEVATLMISWIQSTFKSINFNYCLLEPLFLSLIHRNRILQVTFKFPNGIKLSTVNVLKSFIFKTSKLFSLVNCSSPQSLATLMWSSSKYLIF